MAETQEKRTDGSASANNDVKNQTGNPGQNNMQSGGGGDAKNSSGAQTTDKLGDVLGSMPDTKEILKQAKETAGQAYEKVSEQASSQIVTQKETLARGLSSVADGIKQMGASIRGTEDQTPIAGLTARYGDSLAQQVEQVANYLERKDLRELVRDVEIFARRNPAVFIGGAFALGIAAARFLKSGNPNQALMRRPRREREGIYIPDASEGVYLPEDLSRKVGLTDTSSGASNIGATGSGTTGSGASSTGTGTSTGNTTTGGTTSTTDRTSSDAFSTNKGG
jgi:hypothetical protein